MKALLEKIREILRNRRTRQLLTRTVSIIAALIVFVTTYALVLPAITMETGALCGMDAHQHDESCYSKELVCGLEESENHRHTEECYISILSCGKEAHIHSVECYKSGAELAAQMEAVTVASTESAAIAEPDLIGEGSGEFTAKMSEGSGSDYETKESGLPDEAEPDSIETGAIPGAHGSFEKPGTDKADNKVDDAAADEDLESGSKEADYDPGTVSEDSDKRSSGDGKSEDLTENDKGGKAAADSIVRPATAVSETPGITETSETADSQDNSGTAGTEIPSADAGQGYVPVLEELNFNGILNKNTAIYYSHTDTQADNQTDGNSDKEESGAFDAAEQEEMSEAADFESVANWKKADKETELAPADLLRVYLAYTIPAGELNETNATARYRLPSGFTLTDEQINTINTNVNGIAAQYVDYDKLEIIDAQAYENSLGIEAVEGTRCPSDDIREYLKENDNQEYVSATVKAENVYDEESGELEGQDLIFSFAPYTVMKNRHEYDANGKPVKAGEKVRGWVCLDLTTDQVEWETSDQKTALVRQIEEKTAEVVFAEEDREAGVDEISAKLKMLVVQNTGEAEDYNSDTAEAAEDRTEAAGNKEDAENAGASGNEDLTGYPAVSFDDRITVTAGSLASDIESRIIFGEGD